MPVALSIHQIAKEVCDTKKVRKPPCWRVFQSSQFPLDASLLFPHCPGGTTIQGLTTTLSPSLPCLCPYYPAQWLTQNICARRGFTSAIKKPYKGIRPWGKERTSSEITHGLCWTRSLSTPLTELNSQSKTSFSSALKTTLKSRMLIFFPVYINL